MSSRSSESDLPSLGTPPYLGRDARPTSRKELLGWYMYGFAAEVYVVCGIGKLTGPSVADEGRSSFFTERVRPKQVGRPGPNCHVWPLARLRLAWMDLARVHMALCLSAKQSISSIPQR